jgi:hypothetical protein
LWSKRATSATVNTNKEIRLATNLIERVEHEHAIDDHGTPTIKATRNSTP